MTVSYVSKVATSKFWKFLQLLLVWRGSIYKMVWFEMVLFGILYSSISITYRNFLYDEYKIMFEKFCIYCQNAGNFMPIAFILSFYVTMIAKRWWDQFKTIPWPDSISLVVSAYINDDTTELINTKRNIVRYTNVSLMLFLRSISPQIKKKFPVEESIVDSQLLSEQEYAMFESVDGSYNKYYVPLLWAANLTKKAFKDGAIKTEGRMMNIIWEISQYREKLNRLYAYDWVNPPLVYTQTATIAVYTYFVICLFSTQFLDPLKQYKNHEIDLYVPIFSIVQMIFYFGWLKVAESLINPFGEDDDDFDCFGLIERNLTASFLLVNPLTTKHPGLRKDVRYFNEMPIDCLAANSDKNGMNGSLMQLN